MSHASHEDIDLRVNGTEYPEVTRRFAMEDGYPGGKPEIVVRDAQLGEFTLTDDCFIEIGNRRLKAPGWVKVSLKDFTRMVEAAIQLEQAAFAEDEIGVPA